MNIFRLKNHLCYAFFAHYRKGYGVQSPFVYRLITDVIEGSYPYYCFDEIEAIRYGLKPMVRRRCLPAKYARMFFRLINFLQPRSVVEFGLGDGITAQYLTNASSKARSVYMDEVKNRAQVQKLLKGVPVDVVIFYSSLDATQCRLALDEVLLAHHEDSVLLLAGIHDSPEKQQLWKSLLSEKDLTMSIDLFQWGMVFFRKSLEKRNYVLRY